MADVGPGTFGYLCGLARREELPGPVLTPILTGLGLSPAGARTYLSRMVRAGDLSSRRVGRCSVYSMVGDYLAEFRHLGSPRDFHWEGAFHTVILDIGEDRRAERDALLRAAHASGFRQLRPGVLVGAHAPGEWAQKTFIGTWAVDEDTARNVIATAWDLEDSAARISALGDVPPLPTDDVGIVVETTRRHAAAFAALRRTPPFPAQLLPADFPAELLESRLRMDITPAYRAMARLLESWP
ncbi:PaaX protein [Corynebacterium hiratae]|uniref:PaaX protein n=1 Tax=Corynebacterium aurimucosum TaxID=169292 RepID=A0A6I3KCN3_9CORY|nr:PaaX protein [Corynebacterium aurimucosum]MTD91916.1 PaaX protein [Corynebacterium aurimucosum]